MPTGPRKLDCPSALLGFNFLALPTLGCPSSVTFHLTPLIGMLPRAACKALNSRWEEISFLPIFLFFWEKRSEMWREAAVWMCDKHCLSHSMHTCQLWSSIMDDNNEILQEYWYTDLSSSYSDISQSQSQSQSTDDQVMDIAAIFIALVMKEVISYGTSTYDKMPYHTSALTGEMWVTELLHGHPE